MDRKELLLSMFDSRGFGLEVGPSYNPLLPKSRGFNVETIDHADAEALRIKYSDNASQIEEIDYISDGSSILDVIGKKGRYDFIFASHVVEHVTDIVRFIQDCESLLRPDGRLVLAVPDKRYCFDTLRPLSTVGQALQAYIEQRSRHPAGVIFDHEAYVCAKANQIVWVEPTLDDLALMQDNDEAKNAFESAQAGDSYHDAHGWQFTPTSFRYLIKTLRALGYIKSGELQFHKNDSIGLHMHEFYISLSKAAPVVQDSDIDMLKEVEGELREVAGSRNDKHMKVKVEDLESNLAEANRHIESANQQIQYLTARTDAVLRSTSWRITAPLRYIRSMLKCVP